MKYTFKNDLENNKMDVEVTINLRKQANHELEIVKWHDVQKIVAEHYKCPKNYKLGTCNNPVQYLNGDNHKRCKGTWTYELHEIVKAKPATKQKPPVKKASTKKKKTAGK